MTQLDPAAPLPRPRLLGRILASDASRGVGLMLATAVALVLGNSPLAEGYHHLLATPLPLGALRLDAHGWINDGLMALFFLLVGLEIKRELLVGELAGWRKAALPAIAALGGMAAPALIYLATLGGFGVLGGEHLARGWGVPIATDIAFAVGVLGLLGRRVPPQLKLWLTALAVIDDLGAVLVIAFFYTGSLSLPALGGAVLVTLALVALNRMNVRRLWPYLVLGVVLWAALLRSGIHATLAGVILAFCIPEASSQRGEQPGSPPLERLEHALDAGVTLLVLPLFALANAAVAIPGAKLAETFAHPAGLGIFLGLLVGKQVGVYGASVAAVRLGLAELPRGVARRHLYGGALLAGIGFTMSIFIAELAFPGSGLLDDAKRAVLLGSLGSALLGVALLSWPRRSEPPPARS